MKAFETPVVDVIKFSVEDVITESGVVAPTTAASTLPALIPPCAN